ncbi:cell division protein FtsZ [Helicobacter apodemus]|uniref:Cell division protein FtsZ n=1 Tax=Helicobacter apodemus TaxID=135569 RepID=A0A099UAD1_9HELI|nr:cell division protein FtsZ [Helicobacter apodemus]AWI34937.1 cell division protein FtsZ [Helicobacter apodemus]MDE6958469.1 cell division protein FtsZ [Helicobacter apodemus]TLE16042.1 cell division protein FtsZ [Helicobacter apodemus]
MIEIQEVNPNDFSAKIKVIGVGGGGSNMVAHLINTGTYDGIELAVANTDAQAISTSNAPIRIQLGAKLTKGLGAGMKPQVGKDAALESYEDLKIFLEGTDIVFISAGLGGGTGTGAAPIIAKAAKEAGALTVSIVTKPFKWEGRQRARLAEDGYKELKAESDSIVVIPNDKLLSIVDKNLGLKDSFRIVDDVLVRAVNGMSGVILSHSAGDINVDFADVKTVMNHKGLALMGIGEASGADAAREAIKIAIESPLFDNMSINGAKGVLIHFYFNPDYPIYEMQNAMEIIYENTDPEAEVIFGTTTDESIERDKVRVTIIATGFEKEALQNISAEIDAAPLKLVSPKDMSQKINQVDMVKKKVSGADFIGEEMLDVPTFLRNQMD